MCLDCSSTDVVGLRRCPEHFLVQYEKLIAQKAYIFRDGPKALCLLDGCGRIAPTRLLCHKHYQRHRAGTLFKALIQRSIPKELNHGRHGTYSNDKCRCELCTIANNSYHAGLRAKRKQNIPENAQLKHGSANAYYNHSCRCEECLAWGRESNLQTAPTRNDRPYWLFQRAARNGICDLCKNKSEVLNWDHDHISGNFRGYLCTSCNTGLGKLGDSMDGLRQALRYLESEPLYY